MSFSDIIGQEIPIDILSKQLTTGKVSHAYLFLGPEGVGRKKTAIEFASILNCKNKTTPLTSCGSCLSCNKIKQNIHPDVQIIDFNWQANILQENIEKQKSIKIETIKRLHHDISLKPMESNWKVFIIEPAEKITIDAANCLLKILEEPPLWTIIILIAKDKENLPKTIISRTQIIRFRTLTESEIKKFLENNYNMSSELATSITARAEGSLSNAIKLNIKDELSFDEFYINFCSKKLNLYEILLNTQNFSKNLEDFINGFLNYLKIYFRKDPNKFGRAISVILESKVLINMNVNQQMILDSMLLKIYNILDS